MKKLITLVCVVALVFSLVGTALANGSIGELQPIVNPGTMKDHMVTASVAAADDKWIQEVSDVFSAFNNAESNYSLKDLIAALMQLPVNSDKELNGDSLELKDEAGQTTFSLNLEEADFVSSFSQNCLNYDGTVFYTFNGNEVPVVLNLVYDQLKGRNANEFSILAIEPTTGYFTFIELDPENFNPETGEIIVEIPFLGIYALIEK